MRAELDYTRRRVVCGRVGCGAEIASVLAAKDGRVVFFWPGWSYGHASSRWELSARSAARLSQGRPPTRRRERQDEFTGAVRIVTPMSGRVTGRALYRFPAKAKCPGCGSVNTLDARRFDVLTWTEAKPEGIALSVARALLTGRTALG